MSAAATNSIVPPMTNIHRTPIAAASAPLARAPATMIPRVNTRAETLTRPRSRFGVSRCWSDRATGMRTPAGSGSNVPEPSTSGLDVAVPG